MILTPDCRCFGYAGSRRKTHSFNTSCTGEYRHRNCSTHRQTLGTLQKDPRPAGAKDLFDVRKTLGAIQKFSQTAAAKDLSGFVMFLAQDVESVYHHGSNLRHTGSIKSKDFYFPLCDGLSVAPVNHVKPVLSRLFWGIAEALMATWQIQCSPRYTS